MKNSSYLIENVIVHSLLKIVKAFKNTFDFKPNLFIFEKLFVVIVKHSVTCTQFWAKKLLCCCVKILK